MATFGVVFFYTIMSIALICGVITGIVYVLALVRERLFWRAVDELFNDPGKRDE